MPRLGVPGTEGVLALGDGVLMSLAIRAGLGIVGVEGRDDAAAAPCADVSATEVRNYG